MFYVHVVSYLFPNYSDLLSSTTYIEKLNADDKGLKTQNKQNGCHKMSVAREQAGVSYVISISILLHKQKTFL